jgi:hypothetical protein
MAGKMPNSRPTAEENPTAATTDVMLNEGGQPTNRAMPDGEGDCDWRGLPLKDLVTITASRWTLVSEGLLVLISNPQKAPGRRIWVEGNFGEGRAPGRKLHVISYALGGARSDSSAVVDGKGGVTLEVPESRLSFIAVLPEEMVAGGR